jgi:hypothetical protein
VSSTPPAAPVDPAGSVRPLPSAPADGGPRWAAVIGAAGLVEVLVLFLAFRARLPTEVPDHFAATGTADGWLAPVQLLEVQLFLVASVAVLITAVLIGAARSSALRFHHGRAFVRPLLGLEAAVTLVSVPGSFAVVLLNALGTPAIAPSTMALLLNGLGVFPIVVIIGLLVASRGQRLPSAHDPVRRAGAEHAFLGIGGHVEFSCPACGGTFVLDGIPLLAPHMAFGGEGSIYLRCPRCGERGWCAIVRRLR